jgi:hypothetical protein
MLSGFMSIYIIDLLQLNCSSSPAAMVFSEAPTNLSRFEARMLLLLVGVLGPGIFLLARHHMAQNWSTMNSPDLKTSSRIQSNRE